MSNFVLAHPETFWAQIYFFWLFLHEGGFLCVTLVDFEDSTGRLKLAQISKCLQGIRKLIRPLFLSNPRVYPLQISHNCLARPVDFAQELLLFVEVLSDWFLQFYWFSQREVHDGFSVAIDEFLGVVRPAQR